ncbi:MAG TPA: hypothetical protein VHT25_03070 [Solirubrobacteraceae bacterium]|jgi:L-lactate permease|nr:hypothetical protein [Solirubrobacteraceae bacterium]
MLALLFAVALIALTVLALALAGVVAAIVTGVALVNVFAALLGMRSRSLHDCRAKPRDRWRPKSFRMPPELTQEPDEEHARSLTVHRR